VKKIIHEMVSIFIMLDAKLRNSAVWVLLLMLISSAADALSVASLIPYISFMLEPVASFGRYETLEKLTAPFLSREQQIAAITVAYVVLVLGAGLIRLRANRRITIFSFDIGHWIATKIYEVHLKKNYEKAIKTPTNKIISAVVYNTDGVVYQVIMPALTSVSSLISLVLLAVVVGVANLSVLLVASITFISLYSLINLPIQGRYKANGEVITRSLNKSLKTLQEGLNSIKDIVIDGGHTHFSTKYAALDNQRRQRQAENIVLSTRPRIIIETFFVVGVSIFIFAMHLAGDDLSNVAAVTGVLVVASAKALPLINNVYLNVANIRAGEAALDDVLGQLSQVEPVSTKSGQPVSFLKSIELKNLTYRREGKEAPILIDVNLQIKAGEKVAIIGPSGSGKSTLLDILMGLVTEHKGDVLVDGVIISKQNAHCWHKEFGHVPQAIYMLDDSIENNIVFLTEMTGANRESRLAKVKRIMEIEDLELDRRGATIGENGREISGGQKQRVGIARALFKSQNLLILDEATSALDEETESRMISSLLAGFPDITVIMITHRINSLSFFDSVYELRDGRLKSIEITTENNYDAKSINNNSGF
jgi:ATP-binding cassette subfamily B protein